jgi:biotin-dependent carboxylase-like uncharacterized protein
MTLRVLDPGLHTLIVDYGRPGSRSLGVAVGGAADRFALSIGNALVGNRPNTPALEISLAGPTVEAECDLACAVYGAPFVLSSNQQKLVMGTTFTLHSGEVFGIGGTAKGMRAYLCVQGGIESLQILGSFSALEPLTANTVLRCVSNTIGHRFVRGKWLWNADPTTLRVVEGPQAGWFNEELFYQQVFTVTPNSNRMGLRTHGEPLKLPERELESEPVCPGSVQVTRDGQCIILGVDGQTIGGYPKIAQVISADLDKLGQLRPDDRIRFVRVTLADAESLYREKLRELDDWLTRLRVAERFS